MKPLSREDSIRAYYRTLFQVWGPQHWWPGRTRFEVIVGAYLTQNTAWTNVEQALRKLRNAGLLTLSGIRQTKTAELEGLIRSAGYFRQKARRLKTFVDYLDGHYNGSLTRMLSQPRENLRTELVTLNGVGRETADSILLYAGNHPVFVVDAYTRRVLHRHDVLPEDAPYEEVRALVEVSLARLADHVLVGSKRKNLKFGTARGAAAHRPSRMSIRNRTPLVQIYNEMHGLIVEVGKNYCLKSKPRCEQCPLRPFLPGK